MTTNTVVPNLKLPAPPHTNTDTIKSPSAPSTKLVSPLPIPMSACITPPPSSQHRHINKPQLSSPPSTLRLSAELYSPRNCNSIVTDGIPSPEAFARATVEQLRDMVNDLCVSVRESRISAAHYKLQFRMLTMDSTEAANRMGVELDMAQREVEVYAEANKRLRHECAIPGAPHNQQQQQPESAATATLLHEMSRHCSLLQQENVELQDRLAQKQHAFEARGAEIDALKERNEELCDRIRQNRDHIYSYINHIHELYPHLLQQPDLAPEKSNPRADLEHCESQQDQPRGFLDTLLLADKVLSQETKTTAPNSTPRRGTGGGAGKIGRRSAQSNMSFLPSTPQRRPLATAVADALGTLPSFAPMHPPEPPRTVPAATCASRRGSRLPSSDSTVSASSVHENEERIRAAQAAAVRILSSGKPARGSAGKGQRKLKQTKLFGQVGKPGVRAATGEGEEKKKMMMKEASDEGCEASPAKKVRTAGEGVGLGLGFGMTRG